MTLIWFSSLEKETAFITSTFQGAEDLRKGKYLIYFCKVVHRKCSETVVDLVVEWMDSSLTTLLAVEKNA